MAVAYQRFTHAVIPPEVAGELDAVDEMARRLVTHLDDASRDIDAVHVHRAQSSAVQEVVARLLREHLGFREERVLTPSDGFVTSVRPDFFYSLGPRRGILAEVERGGTTTNNHDLKDVWKAHIAPDAHHLFLVVPNANWSESGAPRERPFHRVVRRVAAFFGDQRREVDVMSLHVFGYGRDA